MGRILITGGAGYIGSHICFLLLSRGYKVIVFDSFVNSSYKLLDNIKKQILITKPYFSGNLEVVDGDIRNKYILQKLFERSIKTDEDRIIGVIHCAGLKSISDSIKRPFEYWDNNVLGSINLFNIMQSFKCKKIVFSSSASIYECSNLKLHENSKINPKNTYGNTKYVIEKLLRNIFESEKNEWSIANLRYFNPIGAHPEGIIGEDSNGHPNNIFPLLNKVAAGKISKIEVFGKDWPTPDGTCLRDYIHIMDLAEGHCLVFDYIFRQNIFLNLNLGTGEGTSVLNLIEVFQKVNKVKIPFTFTSRRIGDNGIVIADNRYAKDILNWVPKRSIEDMCRDGWKWERNNL